MLQPTRRTVIRTAAWSVPAVSLAAAAPAYAVSEPGQLVFLAGDTAPVAEDGFLDLDLSNAYLSSVATTGGSAALAEVPTVRLEVTFTRIVPAKVNVPEIREPARLVWLSTMPGWTLASPTETDTLVYTHDPIPVGTSIPLFSEQTRFFGALDSDEYGIFHLRFSGPNSADVTADFARIPPSSDV